MPDAALTAAPSAWWSGVGRVAGRIAAALAVVVLSLVLLVELAPGTPADLVRDPETGTLPACFPPGIADARVVVRLPAVATTLTAGPWSASWTEAGCPRAWAVLAPRVGVSATLGALSLVFGVLVGALGGFAAAARGGSTERIGALLAGLVQATPPFTVALLAVVAAPALGLPARGSCTDPLAGCPWTDRLLHLVLPAATLALFTAAPVARLTRAHARALLDGELVRALRARGLSERRVLVAHALPLSLGPAVQIAGLSLPRLAAGSVLVEKVFGLPGMGSQLADSAARQDLPVILLGFGMVAVAVVLGQEAAEAGAVALDPRRREGGRS